MSDDDGAKDLIKLLDDGCCCCGVYPVPVVIVILLAWIAHRNRNRP